MYSHLGFSAYTRIQIILICTHVDNDTIVDRIWRQSLAHRIHCMWYGDLTHDGLSELAIVSTGGVHILQVRAGSGHFEEEPILVTASVAAQYKAGQCSMCEEITSYVRSRQRHSTGQRKH